MNTALIGYTGFVGTNLANQNSFTDTYNTSNIDTIDGREYDLVVSAATYSEVWRINQAAEEDMARITALIQHLKKIKAKKFVLISTVCVYKNPVGVDEDTPIDLEGLMPYGVNRYHLEQFCQNNFDTLIVRLPGLFGHGLKKNVIYDFLHDNNTDRIPYNGVYQYYNLDHIWQDIQTALLHNLNVLNLATAPVRTDEVLDYCFGIKNFKNEPEGVKPANFDMHTKHAPLFGATPPYLASKQQILDEIKAFVAAERAKQ